MPFTWRADRYLSQIESDLNHYDIISFDVFDTMLFRACGEPADVFDLVGEELESNCESWPHPARVYKTVRQYAECRARGRAVEDCTFESIFAEMPYARDVVSFMFDAETACEKRVLYLNPGTHSLLRHCAALGKRIVLVSDMYHSSKRILEFLAEAGADADRIAGLYVSSEQNCFKYTGALFQKMLADFPHIPPEKVLHIGDNARADVEGAAKAGIRALHYPVKENSLGSIYSIEHHVYRIQLGEILSLRQLAAARCGESDPEPAFHHAFGAAVIGPLYALFADWVVAYAAKRSISRVLPLMREGTLLSKAIARAAKAAGKEIECGPAYLSRQTAFVASIFEANYEERISQTLLRGGRDLKAIFDDFGLPVGDTPFARFETTPLADLKAHGHDREVEAYFSSGSVRAAVLAHSRAQRELLLRYVDGLTGGKAALTVDIGIKGTTERYLNDIKIHGGWRQPLCNALMMGSTDSNANNLLDGVDIASWLGIAGENGDIIGKLKYQILILESFVNDTCGSTIRYESEGGAVRPVLEPEILTDRQKAAVAACWEGVETFQRLWLSLSSRKPRLRESLLNRKADFLKIWLRAVETPTAAESELLGGFPYRDAFNANEPRTLTGRLPAPGLDKAGVGSFVAKELKSGACWPQAAVARVYPDYALDRVMDNLDDVSIEQARKILKAVQEKGLNRGVVFCASELGRKFSELAALMKVPLACFVDSNRRLHGSAINGLTVRALDDVADGVDYYVIATYIYAKEIRNTLEAKYPDPENRPLFFDFGME